METQVQQQAPGKSHEIHITVDGEPVTTEQREVTPNQIIRDFGGKDPATNYLSQIKGHEKISYQGQGDTPIELHNGMKFQIIPTGPTTVSENAVEVGTAAFVRGLQQMGYTPNVDTGKPDHVAIDYVVETGRCAGKQVRLGFIVPGDFPAIVPTGPHVSPRIHPVQNNGDHPYGGVLEDRSQGFAEAFGGEWQYWSRPCPEWPQSRKTVATYMSHVWRLWDTQ